MMDATRILGLLALMAGCAGLSGASGPDGEAVTGAAAPPLVSEEAEPPPVEEEPAEKNVLAILPFRDVTQEAIDTAVKSIEHAYGWEVVVMERHDLPKSAWYKPKKRYRAELLLDWLHTKIPEGADRIMGLTKKDISTTKGSIHDWGICGLAEAPGEAAVVSTYRIKKKMGKLKPADRKKKYLQRLRDLTAHEFGHTLGLPHCPNTGCVMEDAKGTVLTFDHSTGKLCDDCIASLKAWGYSLPGD